MIFFAAATNTFDKLKEIPPSFWAKIGLAVLAVIVVVLVLRTVFKINKFILAVVCFIAIMFMFVNWVYHRTEPAFMTPIVEKIAPFLPSAADAGKH